MSKQTKAPAASGNWIDSVLVGLIRVLQQLRRQRAQQVTREMLMALDDKLLNDLGMCRNRLGAKKKAGYNPGDAQRNRPSQKNQKEVLEND